MQVCPEKFTGFALMDLSAIVFFFFFLCVCCCVCRMVIAKDLLVAKGETTKKKKRKQSGHASKVPATVWAKELQIFMFESSKV